MGEVEVLRWEAGPGERGELGEMRYRGREVSDGLPIDVETTTAIDRALLSGGRESATWTLTCSEFALHG